MYRASVIALGHECDLAELRVEGEEFWGETQTLLDGNKYEVEMIEEVQKKKRDLKRDLKINNPKELVHGLEMGEIPYLHSKVTVIGYPTGGDNVSVTRGVVSRIEPQSYAMSPTHELLAIQIDAAINPGNSGGPALDDQGRVVGVAFQSLQGAENIGYIIPTPVIKHFIEDIHKNGEYSGFVRLGLLTQSLDQTHSATEYFKLKQNMSGLLVVSVDPTSDAINYVKQDDILVKVEGEIIANDGTIKFRKHERIHFNYLLLNKFAQDPCKITVWRNGKLKELSIMLKPKIRELVPLYGFVTDRMPSYIIYGGLVFTRLTFAYLSEYGEEWYNSAPRLLLHKAFQEVQKTNDEEIVILSHILVDDCNLYVNFYIITN